jgi:hypothetical protein
MIRMLGAEIHVAGVGIGITKAEYGRIRGASRRG